MPEDRKSELAGVFGVINPIGNKITWFSTLLICASCASNTSVIEKIVFKHEELTERKNPTFVPIVQETGPRISKS